MSDSTKTVQITLEVTEQQYDDALRAINNREVHIYDNIGDLERRDALTNVWAQLYRGGKETFREAED